MKAKLLKKLRAEAKEVYRLEYSNSKYYLIRIIGFNPNVKVGKYYCEKIAIDILLKRREQYVSDLLTLLKKERDNKFKRKLRNPINNEINKRIKNI